MQYTHFVCNRAPMPICTSSGGPFTSRYVNKMYILTYIYDTIYAINTDLQIKNNACNDPDSEIDEACSKNCSFTARFERKKKR